MTFQISRRGLLGAAGLASAFPWARAAWAQKVQLTGVMWGGAWLEGAKKVTETQTKYDIKWELHTGGAAAIIPKIQASWPNVPYDFVAQFSPLFYTWERAGWPEPLTVEEMPNLKDIPDEMFHRDAQGRIVSVPISFGASIWGYRKDTCPVEIKVMEDLLNPKLKGQLCVRDAVQGMNNNTLSYALAFGGSEKNMEPGWEFLKKLAKSGNIGRVAKTEADFVNSLTTGETSVSFLNPGNWSTVAKSFPIELLIRDKAQAPGFQAISVIEGFMIPKGSARKKEAKEYLNHFVGPEGNTIYNQAVNYATTNLKSTPTDFAKVIVFKDKAERAKFVHNPDFGLLADQRETAIKRFETEIVPLLR